MLPDPLREVSRQILEQLPKLTDDEKRQLRNILLLEKLPEVQSLSAKDKWRLIDGLWSDLAREIEGAGVDENTLALLNQRFDEYTRDPSPVAS
jgi:Putative addiction module component